MKNKIKQTLKDTYTNLSRNVLKIYFNYFYIPEIYFVNPERKDFNFDGPTIIISNHPERKDGVFFKVLFGDSPVYMVVAKDIYENPIVKLTLQDNQCVPIDRKNLDTYGFREIIKILNKGNSICIFPEGHSERGEGLDNFKPGFIMMAYMSRAKIVTVYHDEEYRLFHKHRFIVDEPIELTKPQNGMTDEYMKNEAKRFHNRLIELKELEMEGKKDEKLFLQFTNK